MLKYLRKMFKKRYLPTNMFIIKNLKLCVSNSIQFLMTFFLNYKISNVFIFVLILLNFV